GAAADHLQGGVAPARPDREPDRTAGAWRRRRSDARRGRRAGRRRRRPDGRRRARRAPRERLDSIRRGHAQISLPQRRSGGVDLVRPGAPRWARREGRPERLDLHARRAVPGRRRAAAPARHRGSLVRGCCAQGDEGIQRPCRSLRLGGPRTRLLSAPPMNAAQRGGLMRALRLLIAAATVMLVLWAPPAQTEVELVGPEIPVNTFLPGDQQFSAVSTDANGGFVVVWQSGGYSATQDGSLA